MTEQIKKIQYSLNSSLKDNSKPWTQVLDWAEEKSGIPRFYLFVGAASLCGIYLIFGYAAQLLCNIISVLYPAYVSIKAIESHTKEDDTKWLTYWVLYAAFSLVEFFSVFVKNFIPFFYLLKCAFFIWCMLPIQNNGAIIIYHKIIRPYFLKHQSLADKAIDDLIEKSKDIAADVLKKAK